MRASIGRAFAAMVAASAALALTAPSARAAVTKVAYVSGGSVYLEAGRDAGVAAGDSAAAMRDGQRIAGLIIREATGRRAVCDTFQVRAMPDVGDEVRFRARAPEAVAAAPESIPPETSVVPARPIRSATARRAWRGRVALGFLDIANEGASDIRQPTLAVRLDHVGSALDLHADVRGRSTTIESGTDREARVYRLAGTLHDDASQRRLTFGRQVLVSAPGAAFFDGAVAEFDRGAWTWGLFGGGAPDPGDFAPSFTSIQSGGFARVRQSRPGRTWQATLGVFDSRYKGTADRDAVFLDASHTAPGRALFLSQEVDVNPSWKRALGDPAVGATSTFLYARQSVGPTVTLDGGFDNRRSVRLARDRETAETTFDDRYRRGGWSGVTWAAKRWVRLGGSGRWSGGLPHATRSFTGTALVRRPTAYDLSFRWRTTLVDGNSRGWLHVGEGEWSVRGIRVRLSAGLERWNDANGITVTSDNWQEIELEQSLGARIYGFVSGERRSGDGGRSNLGQAGLSYFF